MALKVVEQEVARFLADEQSEVLCMRGPWGVGKTHAWRQFLAAAKRDDRMRDKRYSYVSLFGLNSLEELRFAIFENTVTGDHVNSGPDVGTFASLLDRSSDFARKLKPAVKGGFALLGRSGVSDAVLQMAFLAVRNQTICIDDLERAGHALAARDVLGLASFLKEERDCKVVLLLNEEALDEGNRTEFQRHLEKTVDIALSFETSAAEALEIAALPSTPEQDILGERVVALGLTNIRVIRKMAGLADRLTESLEEFDTEVRAQAITTLVLGSWSVLQPDVAPPLALLRDYNSLAASLKARDTEGEPVASGWKALLEGYPFTITDGLDHVIFDGVTSGFFDRDALLTEAGRTQDRLRHQSRDNSYSRAWSELYHGSLAIDDDQVLDGLFKGALENLRFITPLNLNSALYLLREHERGDQADVLVERYIDAHAAEKFDFFEISSHHFSREDQIDEGLQSAFAKRLSEYVDPRPPLDVLYQLAENRGWDDADVHVLAQLSADDFEQLFETLRGPHIKRIVGLVVAISRSPVVEAGNIAPAAKEALRRIASKSPLRSRRVLSYGIDLAEP